MSVLIKNMSVPDNCNKCVFCVNGFADDAPMYECAASGDDMTSVLVDDHGKPFDFRPDWCPLIEIKKPHGDLVDRGELMDIYADRLTAVAERYSPDSSECGILSGAMKLLAIQPTVIEAEE